jgi:transcriptional regulator with XRE-family HTH domain
MQRHFALCAIRRERRSWGLSQQELAALLGFTDRTRISRIEHGERIPGLETALACATLFGVSLGELFPQLAARVRERLEDRIAKLGEGLLHPTNPSRSRKQELLMRALAHANEEAFISDV